MHQSAAKRGRYQLLYHKLRSNSRVDKLHFQMGVSEIARETFRTLAKAVDFRNSSSLEEYAIRKIANASTFGVVHAEEEAKVEKAKIPFLKPHPELPPTEYNLRRGLSCSLTVSIEYEEAAAGMLTSSRLIKRYYEPRFDEAKIEEQKVKRPQSRRGIENEFLADCYAVTDEVSFDPVIVEIALGEALSELGIVEFDIEPEKRQVDFDWVEDPIKEDPEHPDFVPPDAEGVCFDIEGIESIERLRKVLPAGYQAYEYQVYLPKYVEDIEQEPPGARSLSKAAIVKDMTDDQFLKYMGTARINWSGSSADLRKKFESWKSKYRCILLGASEDSLTLRFPVIEKRHLRKRLSEEVVAFCPELVQMGPNSGDEVEDCLASGGIVNLWWD